MKKKLILVLLMFVALFTLAGCGNEDDDSSSRRSKKDKQSETVEEETTEETPKEKKKQKENRTGGVEVNLYNYSEFTDGVALLYAFQNSGLPEGKHFIDDDLNIIYTYDFVTDGEKVPYVKALNKDEKGNINVYYKDGSIVFSYKPNQYKKVLLTNHGYLITHQIDETYNNSEEKIGVYSLKDKKYIVEPSSEYNIMEEYGTDMYKLNYEKEIYFNSRLGKVVKFDQDIYDKFVDGYLIDQDTDHLLICKDDGTCKKIKYSSEGSFLNTRDYVSNGYAVDINNGAENTFRIINLDSGSVTDISDKFYRVTNRPKFDKKGYALVLSANQSGTNYYTVINTKGEIQFDPVKMSSAYSFLGNYDETLNTINLVPNLSHGYIILDGNGEVPSEIRDIKNNLVLQSKKGERFEAVIADDIAVVNHNKAIAEFHYIDLKGNKLLIYPKK